ncbi:hypothetical protein ACEWPL_008535 [Roseovarius sp. S1116L3]|uniref:hypothetical protein n=1 Tax=Roseovarius roseus TaxID=3342636 RepID=UPI0037263EF3
MKPNFALILSSEDLTLLHRTYSGWARVGDARFDDTDLPGTIAALQERAGRLPGDQTCKIVIPEDQIKYLTIEAEGDPDTAVRAALDGATPYAVDELEYDWTAEEGVIHIAAVALETLGEAESFAVENGFEPVGFAAIPAHGDFRGEPFFGATRWAGTALPEGTTIERDAAPIRITGDAEMPAEEDTDAPVAAAAAQAVAEAGPAPKNNKAPEAEADAAKPVMATEAPASSPKAEPAKSTDKAEAPAPTAFTSIRASRGAEGSPRAPLVSGEPRLSRLGGAEPAPATGTAPPLPSPADSGVNDPALMAELAASLQPDPEARLDRDAAAAASDEQESDAPAATGASLPGLFGTRADKEANEVPPKAAKFRPREDEKQRMTVFGARQTEVRGKPRFLGLILTAILLLFLVGVAAWASIFLDDGLARFFGGGDIKLADVPATSEEEADPAASEEEAEAPALIAPLPGGDEARVASLPEDTGAARPEVASLPDRPLPLSPSEAMARYAATGIWQMAPAPPETPGAGAPITDLYQVSLDPGIDLGLPASLPRRTPDARDTVPEAPGAPPPAGTRFDFDARGFVRATPDGAMTPEGVRVVAGRPPLTPPADMAQTVTVTAEVPVAAPDAENVEGGAPATEVITFTGDPALATTRPKVRPSTAIADETGGEQEESDATQVPGAPETRIATAEDAVVTGNASSLAILRPQPRPATMTAAAATLASANGAAAAPLVDGAALTRAIAAASAQPEATATQPAAAEADPEALEDAFDNATPQAVTASLTPLRRPGDFDTTVKRTREQAAAQPVPSSQQMQPALPTSASVAKQATEKNVLKLREVNLIGVYGSSASRRALVRLGNGRYQKVRVGDALDGGQVAAIGESELRYVKRGRNVVLRMPQG